jgi:hypothetical protein
MGGFRRSVHNMDYDDPNAGYVYTVKMYPTERRMENVAETINFQGSRSDMFTFFKTRKWPMRRVVVDGKHQWMIGGEPNNSQLRDPNKKFKADELKAIVYGNITTSRSSKNMAPGKGVPAPKNKKTRKKKEKKEDEVRQKSVDDDLEKLVDVAPDIGGPARHAPSDDFSSISDGSLFSMTLQLSSVVAERSRRLTLMVAELHKRFDAGTIGADPNLYREALKIVRQEEADKVYKEYDAKVKAAINSTLGGEK